eukprot:3043711-Pyramimonas_sp.AAC.3
MDGRVELWSDKGPGRRVSDAQGERLVDWSYESHPCSHDFIPATVISPPAAMFSPSPPIAALSPPRFRRP